MKGDINQSVELGSEALSGLARKERERGECVQPQLVVKWKVWL